MHRSRLIHNIRLGTALLFVALEFTNLLPYLADLRSQNSQFSRYPLQFAGYAICLLVVVLDRRNLRSLLQKRVTLWAGAVLLLFTWAMIVRMFNSPIGLSDYLLVRAFGIQVNNIGFLLTCVLIFDDPDVWKVTKQAIIVATLVSIVLVVSEMLFAPLHFSDISGRGAGLYVQPNSAGMAIVFGCLIGLKTIRTDWPKELFVIACLLGVLATFSRQAALSLAIILVAASLGRALSLRRFVLLGMAGIAMLAAYSLVGTFSDRDILTSDTKARLTLNWSDSSTVDRFRLAYKTLEKFEEAPLLGQGFGTTNYWGDEPSHDAYLGFMADCGILGVLVIPGLVLSIRRKTWDSNAFSVMFLMWGFFTHLVFTELFALMSIAVLAVEPRSREESYRWSYTEGIAADGSNMADMYTPGRLAQSGAYGEGQIHSA